MVESPPGADPAGAITVRLHGGAGRVTAVEIGSSRPTGLAQRLFAGKPVEYLLATLPRVFSVCATAQAAAAVRACEQAGGVVPLPAQEAARDVLVWTETAREHLLRILVGWSTWLGLGPEPPALAAVGRLCGDWRGALYPEADAFRYGGGRLEPDAAALRRLTAELQQLLRTVLGVDAATWCGISDVDALGAWAAPTRAGVAPRLVHAVLEAGRAGLGRSAVPGLPDLPGRQLAGLLDDPHAGAEFTARPTWNGAPHETGALEREAARPLVAALGDRYGNGLLTRLVARLSELAHLPGRLPAALALAAAATPAAADVAASGHGLAQVAAARGRLVHRVHLDRGTVADYRILAPTEWNFHPEGALAAALRDLPLDADAERWARLQIDAVDPCVQYRLELPPGA